MYITIHKKQGDAIFKKLYFKQILSSLGETIKFQYI